jgi:hypothetical protein
LASEADPFCFIHSFFIAPSLLLSLAFVLRGALLLLQFFWISALVIGIVFVGLGFAGLFVPQTNIVAILLLIVQEAWMFSAAVAFGLQRP